MEELIELNNICIKLQKLTTKIHEIKDDQITKLIALEIVIFEAIKSVKEFIYQSANDIMKPVIFKSNDSIFNLVSNGRHRNSIKQYRITKKDRTNKIRVLNSFIKKIKIDLKHVKRYCNTNMSDNDILIADNIIDDLMMRIEVNIFGILHPYSTHILLV